MVADHVLKDERLTGPAKLLYVLLQMHADGRGECFPGLPRLCRLMGLSKTSHKTVQALLTELHGYGYVQYIYRHGKTNLYRLQWVSRPRAPQPVVPNRDLGFPNPYTQGSPTQGTQGSPTLRTKPIELNPGTRAKEFETVDRDPQLGEGYSRFQEILKSVHFKEVPK